MANTKLLMTFPVTATSHTLAEYRARGGYGALEKALRQMTPQQVVAEVTASGIQGRGGAAFPVGRKWAVVHPNDGQPHYLCANADEGEPGTFKDRWILEYAPHLLLESMLIAAYALQVRHAFVYIRGEFDLPYRRLAAALEEAYAAGYFGERILGTDFACDLVIYRGAGSYVCGEASALHHLDRGQARLSAQPPAAPDRARPVPAADRRQQRRDAFQHRVDHREWRRGVQESRHRQGAGHAAHLDLRPHRAPRRLRNRDRLPVRQVHRRGLRRRPRRARAQGRSSPAASRPRC